MHVTVRQTEFSDFEALQGIVQDGPTECRAARSWPDVGNANARLRSARRLVFQTAASQAVYACAVCRATTAGCSAWCSRPTAQPARSRHELVAGDLLVVAPGQERYSAYHGSTDMRRLLSAAKSWMLFSSPPSPVLWICPSGGSRLRC